MFQLSNGFKARDPHDTPPLPSPLLPSPLGLKHIGKLENLPGKLEHHWKPIGIIGKPTWC